MKICCPSLYVVIAGLILIVNLIYISYLNHAHLIVSNVLTTSFEPVKSYAINLAANHSNSFFAQISTNAVPGTPPLFTKKTHYDCAGKDQELRFCRIRSLLRGDRSAQKYFLDQAKKPHYISACVAVKLGGDLIHEFIISNYLAGIDHYYVYDDNDDGDEEDLEALLRPFGPLVTVRKAVEQAEFKELLHWDKSERLRSFKHRQHWMYLHCFKVYGNTTTWLMPIDLDEILEAKRPEQHDIDPVVFEDVPFMQMYLRRIEHKTPVQLGRWNTVLTNNLTLPPQPATNPLSKRYPHTCGVRDIFAEPNDMGYIYCVKSAIQPKYFDFHRYENQGFFFVHGIKHWESNMYKAKELWFLPPFENVSAPLSTVDSEWYILHYWSRSLGDYLAKKIRGRVDGGAKGMEDLIERETACNKIGNTIQSHSAKRRQWMIGQLLNEVQGYSEIQSHFYSYISELLTSHNNSVFVETFNRFLGRAEEQPN